jgi:hypothetical protein
MNEPPVLVLYEFYYPDPLTGKQKKLAISSPRKMRDADTAIRLSESSRLVKIGRLCRGSSCRPVRQVRLLLFWKPVCKMSA